MRLSFVSCLLIVVASHTACPLFADEPAKKAVPCQGSLQLNGKTYKFDQVAAYETKIFDKDGYSILISDKKIPVDKLKAALQEGNGTDDKFIWFEANIKITFDKDGKPMFFNAWADSYSLSGSGAVKGELIVKDGQVRGNASYQDSDGKKNGFEFAFDTLLLVVPHSDPKPAATDKPKKKDKEATKRGAPPAAGATNVSELPIPKDATNVEFKKLVGHISFETSTDLKTQAASLSQKLEALGWSKPDTDLIAAKSAILKRTKGDASLTIFVKPTDQGSKVTIMSEGLSWDEAKPADAAKPDGGVKN